MVEGQSGSWEFRKVRVWRSLARQRWRVMAHFRVRGKEAREGRCVREEKEKEPGNMIAINWRGASGRRY